MLTNDDKFLANYFNTTGCVFSFQMGKDLDDQEEINGLLTNIFYKDGKTPSVSYSEGDWQYPPNKNSAKWLKTICSERSKDTLSLGRSCPY